MNTHKDKGVKECKHDWQIVVVGISTQIGWSGDKIEAVCKKCLERRSL